MILGGKKLKIELVEVFDTILNYRVLEQDESLRGKGTIYTGSELYVSSINAPELACGINRLFIRGIHTHADNIEIVRKFKSSEERATFVTNCKAALEEINKPEPLTFERIMKECIPMKHLLIDNKKTRLYLGFNRCGELVTDDTDGIRARVWHEQEIKDWTIETNEV